MLLHGGTVVAEVARRVEAPFQGTDHPVLEALHVQGHVPIDRLSPRWKAPPDLLEAGD